MTLMEVHAVGERSIWGCESMKAERETERGGAPGWGNEPMGEVHAGADADVDGAAGEDEGALVRGRRNVQVHVLEAALPRVLKVATHHRRQHLLALVALLHAFGV